MKKLNSVVYHKLLLQAQEAKTQNLTKLASGILGAMAPIPEDERVQYDRQQLHNDIYDGLWKLASNVIKYYDVESADVSKIHDRLEALADKFVEEMEQSLGVEDVIAGPFEPALPGQINKVAALHRDKRNSYLALKGGGYGIEVYSKTPPQPGDRVFIDLKQFGQDGFEEEFVNQVIGEHSDLKNRVIYECSIQSQENANRIMGKKEDVVSEPLDPKLPGQE
jgi:hypothetical protein